MTDNRKRDPVMNGEYRTSKDTDPSGEEQGICLNCEDRQICCLPGAGKNVVYCEEYFSGRPDKETDLPIILERAPVSESTILFLYDGSRQGAAADE